jgi:hypothetical protein
LIALKTFALKIRSLSRPVVLLIVLSFSSSSAAAVPLSDYRAAVAVAVADVD